MLLTVKKLFRAGFEPLRGCTTPPRLDTGEDDYITSGGSRTHGSKPRGLADRSITYPARRVFRPTEIFALPDAGANSWRPFLSPPIIPTMQRTRLNP